MSALYTFTKFYQNSFKTSFIQNSKRYQKHNLLGGGNSVMLSSKMCNSTPTINLVPSYVGLLQNAFLSND